jgi:hypothetical protein
MNVRSASTVGLAVVVALAIAAVDVFAPPPPTAARTPEVLAAATPVHRFGDLRRRRRPRGHRDLALDRTSRGAR